MKKKNRNRNDDSRERADGNQIAYNASASTRKRVETFWKTNIYETDVCNVKTKEQKITNKIKRLEWRRYDYDIIISFKV